MLFAILRMGCTLGQHVGVENNDASVKCVKHAGVQTCQRARRKHVITSTSRWVRAGLLKFRQLGGVTRNKNILLVCVYRAGPPAPDIHALQARPDIQTSPVPLRHPHLDQPCDPPSTTYTSAPMLLAARTRKRPTRRLSHRRPH